MTKRCIKCDKIKDISEFLFRKKGKYYEGTCRECNNLRMCEWRKANSEKVRENDKRYYQTQRYKEWRAKHRKKPDVLERERAQVIRYRSQPDSKLKRKEYLNRPEVKERVRSLAKKNKKRPEVIAQVREYYSRPEVKEKQRQYQKEYLNKPEVRDRSNKWRREWRNKNPQIKLRNNISRAIHRSIKEGGNRKHWEGLVGYTLQELMQHIEKNFTEGMTWGKFTNGEIHIDHIIPVSRFNFSSYEDIDFKRCWALSNLQPLWAVENMSKGNKINEPFQPYLELRVAI